MGYNIGIIPAGGKAERFGGTMKDLLPVAGGRALIRRTYDILKRHCDDIVVVSNPTRIQAHVHTLGSDVIYLMTDSSREDIFAGIYAAINHVPADRYYFSMPDTVISENSFDNVPDCDFALGVFETRSPQRFGVIQDGKVINKNPHLRPPCQAWGVLVWSGAVAESWKHQPMTYTQAINQAMAQFGYQTFPLQYYRDISNEEDYFQLLDDMHNWNVL